MPSININLRLDFRFSVARGEKLNYDFNELPGSFDTSFDSTDFYLSW